MHLRGNRSVEETNAILIVWKIHSKGSFVRYIVNEMSAIFLLNDWIHLSEPKIIVCGEHLWEHRTSVL